jgi:hypothetical protein
MLYDSTTGKKVSDEFLSKYQNLIKSRFPGLFDGSNQAVTIQYKQKYRKLVRQFKAGSTDGKPAREFPVPPPPTEISSTGHIEENGRRDYYRYSSLPPVITSEGDVRWPSNTRTIRIEDGMPIEPTKDLALAIFLLYMSGSVDNPQRKASANARFDLHSPEVEAKESIDAARTRHELEGLILFGGYNYEKIKELCTLLALPNGKDEAVDRNTLMKTIMGSHAQMDKFRKFSHVEPKKVDTTSNEMTETLKMVNYLKSGGHLRLKDGLWKIRNGVAFDELHPSQGTDEEAPFLLTEYLLKDAKLMEKVQAEYNRVKAKEAAAVPA